VVVTGQQVAYDEPVTHSPARMMLTRRTATLRLAHSSEAPTIARMSRLHVEHGLRWRWTPKRVRQSIADAESVVLVASLTGGIVGFAIMRFGDDDAHLHLLAVEPLQRRTGTGTALLRWLEESCRTAGIRRIRLEVRRGNLPARRFYERLGYSIVGRIPDYYDRREAAIVFMKRLAD